MFKSINRFLNFQLEIFCTKNNHWSILCQRKIVSRIGSQRKTISRIWIDVKISFATFA